MARVLVGLALIAAGCGFPSLDKLNCAPGAACEGGGDAQGAGGDAPGAGGDAQGAGGDAGGDASCPAVHIASLPVNPTVELLLDASGSMQEPYGATTRWQALRNSLIDPASGLVATLANKVTFGATVYSSQATPPCPLLRTQARAPNNFPAIRDLLVGSEPIQFTPTPESINAVRESFAANPPAAGSPPIILLATDGLPNTCAFPSPTPAQQIDANNASLAAAQLAFAEGIRLYFLFVGDVAAGTHPQQMANAGAGQNITNGTAPVYSATNPADLTAALNLIIDGVRSCDLELDGHVDPARASTGTVKLNGQTLRFGVDWTLDDNGLRVHLVGVGCTMLKSAATLTVDATFPCGP